MSSEIKILPFIYAVFITVAVGFILKYFELQTYFIFLGFRFHLSFILPFILTIKFIPEGTIKSIFKNPEFKENGFFLIIILLPLILVISILFITGNVKLSNPEYFYEFGLSSIFDFPIYLIWNSIQLIFLFIFLFNLSHKIKYGLIISAASILFLFSFEVVSISGEINLFSILNLILFSIITSFLISNFANVYWFTISIFTIIWSYILLTGSNSETIINLLYAANYKSWKGFFTINKEIILFVFPAQLLLVFILLLIKNPFIKRD